MDELYRQIRLETINEIIKILTRIFHERMKYGTLPFDIQQDLHKLNQEKEKLERK